MTASGTQERILDAAECLFAEHGFGDVSVRQVVHTAGVNVASIHYHFGSKEALVEAVMSRRLKPLNDERLRLLDEYESRDEGEVALEDVLYALIAPAVKLSRSRKGGKSFVRLVGRLFAEPSNTVLERLKDRFEVVFIRFHRAFKRTLPAIRKRDYFWRIHFILGAMSLTLCDRERPAAWAEGSCDPDDLDEVIQQLVAFCAAGLRSPVPRKKRKR